jgi:alpha-tubulin suppressor-like RCC1 family protein
MISLSRTTGSIIRIVWLTGLALLLACGHKDCCAPPAVASVTVSPASASVVVGETTQLNATVKDAAGRILTGRVVAWSSSNTTVATASSTGLVTGVTANAVTVISATSEGVSGSATITVMAPVPTLSYASVAAGTYHSCGLTTTGAAYCWGDNDFGELGDGTTGSTSTPVRVAGGVSFALVSVGGNNSCGLTAAGAAHCWGYDVFGALGAGAPGPEICTGTEGSFPCSHHPLAVTGGHIFTTLSANWGLVCALDASGAAYCWGDNTFGALGVGGDTAALSMCINTCSRAPLLVAGGLTFTAIGAGSWHACGLVASGAAYCWGDNRFGQLGVVPDTAPDRCDSAPIGGDGLGPCSRTPIPIGSGLKFTKLRVGVAHSCALATDGTWYCWGVNQFGQLGSGTTGPEICRIPHGDYPCSTQPVAVAGGATFTTVFAGRRHSCAVTSDAVAYCWGENGGNLGDSTTTNSLTPVPVAGGLRFSGLSPFYSHTCGLTTVGVAYCWGSNFRGALGDGTTNSSTVPVRVAGQVGSVRAEAVRSGAAERRSVPSTTRPVLP